MRTDVDERPFDEDGEGPNVFLGIVGSVVGALLGAVLWVVLYQFGIIVSVAGIAIIYCAYKGYSMLYKSKTMAGVVISIIISVLVLVAAHCLCWGLDIYKIGAEHGMTLLDAIAAVPQIALSEGLVIDFFRDLAIGLVLIGVGASSFIRDIIHYNKRRNRY